MPLIRWQNGTAIWSSLLSFYLKELKFESWINTYLVMFTVYSQGQEVGITHMPISRWIGLKVIYAKKRTLLSLQKLQHEWILKLWLVLSEINTCGQIPSNQVRIYLGLWFEGMQFITVGKKAWEQEAKNVQEIISRPTLSVL